jgi:hypothetical protein
MAQPHLSEAVMRATLDAMATHGTIKAAAAAMGVARATFESRLMRARSHGHGVTVQAPTQAEESFRVSGDAAELTKVTNRRIKTLADLVRVCEIDTDEWIIERWTANKWEVGAKGVDGRIAVEPLFQVKAWLKRNTPIIETKAEIAALFADAAKKMPRRPFVKRAKASDRYLLELAIPDLHLGKLAWGEETGGANYDGKVAQEVFRNALESLVDRTSAFRFSRVALPIGNDFFHSDTKAGTTTGGTPLDVDSRFPKNYVIGRRLIVEAVERLRLLAPVTLVMVPGNHDTLSTFCLGDSLACWYRNTPDVEVLNAPTPRKYYQHGKVMLLWTHGDKGKRENLPLLMATEQPKMFGATIHREAHTGHLHTTKVQEHMGVRVRISPALCAADAWHNEQHFVGNARAAEAYVWSKDEGLVTLAVYTVPQ